MKKITAKAKRQQVKKAQKGHGIWVKRNADGTKRTVSARRDIPASGPDLLAERVNLRNIDRVLSVLTGT